MIKICKASITMLFLNLYVVFTLTGHYIPYGTLVFSLISVVTVFVDANSTAFANFIYIRKEIIIMSLFIGVAIVTAPFVSYNSSYAISSITDFIQKWVLCLVIYYICVKERTVEFPLKLFVIIGLFAAIAIINSSGLSNTRIELSENIGENALGNLMVLSFFGVLYFINKYKKTLVDIICIVLGAIYVYTILLTGSRKSLYAVGILIALIIIYKLTQMSRYITYRTLFLVLMVVVFAFVVYKYLLPIFENTAMYLRLYGRQAEDAIDSNQGRIRLYERAIEDFVSNPLFGIGFKNFTIKHGSYTHSAYAEVLACTGLVGFILYFYTYVSTWNSLRNTRKKTTNYVSGKSDMYHYIWYMFYVFLFIGLGIGHLYDNISMVELGIFMSIGVLFKFDSQNQVEKKL